VKSILHQDPRIHVTNFVDFEWVAPLYSAMDIFVLPTYREGFPITLLEAAAMRLPIVTTRVPGCVDAVEDGVTATLVTVRDASALAEAIRYYLDNPDLRAAHGKAGRERVRQHFQQERIWEWIYQEYQSLLAQHHLV
jgi:glycosyltransferase involved in cell wall biosynthesis